MADCSFTSLIVQLEGIEMVLEDKFREQRGLITRTQARRQGLTDRQIDYRLANGSWDLVQQSVYRLRSAPVTWESRLLAATLATNGVASHRCAAALWYLDLYDAPKVEITIPVDQWKGSWDFVTHRSTQWGLRSEVMRRGIRCTGVERTILDCGGVVSARTVERLAEAAVRKNLTTWMRLVDCLNEHSRKGRNGCLNLRRVLNERVCSQTVPLSDFSRIVANLLADNGIPRPVLEYRIVDESGRLVLQTDLAWPELRKCWELDGLAYHFGRTDIERDKRKRNAAKSLGWSIQEILWSMYSEDPEQLVTMARKFLGSHQ